MLAAYRRTSQTHRLLPLVSLGMAAEPVQAQGRYGAQRRPNWIVIGILAAVHAAGLYALVKLDVIPIAAPAPKPIVVELIETPEMAPAPPEPAEPAPPEQLPAPVVAAPVPIVQAPVPAPVTIAVAPPPAVNVPAPPAASAAPISPPDFSDDYLKNPAPRYPVESRRLKEMGTVTVKVLVSPEGAVQELKLAESSGHSRLDKAALAAIRGWRFAPAKQAGKAVAAWVIVPVPFVLQG